MFPKLTELNSTKKAVSVFEEFKNFAFKGNMIDLAVGVVIGAAFGKIIDSLVKQIIMPSLSLLMPSEQGYLGWKLIFHGKEIPYGLFLGEVVNFLIVAMALFFFIVKFLGGIIQFKKSDANIPQKPSKDQELLTEIRDLLKTQKQS